MTDPTPPWQPAADEEQGALRERERLRSALGAIERMAGDPERPDETAEQAAARAVAYAAAPPVARRRFAALVTEASASAAAGIAALIRYRAALGRDCAPAADRLAGTIRQALADADRLTARR